MGHAQTPTCLVSAYLTVEERAGLATLAARQSRSMAAHIRHLIRRELDAQDEDGDTAASAAASQAE